MIKSLPFTLPTLCGAILMTMAVGSALAEDAPLKYGNTQVQDLLTEYGRLIGKTVIADPTVQGRLSVVTDAPVSREQAAALIEKTLFLYDYTLIDSGADTVEVLGLGKIARSHALPVYAKPEEIPAAERVFSYVIKPQHRDPVAILSFLAQYIPPTNVIGYTADNASKTLVVTAPTSLVRRMLRMVDALDVPAAEGAKTAAASPEAATQPPLPAPVSERPSVPEPRSLLQEGAVRVPARVRPAPAAVSFARRLAVPPRREPAGEPPVSRAPALN